MASLNESQFHDIWGTGGAVPAPVTRSLDTKAFENQWLAEPPPEKTKENTDTINSSANAALGGIVEGIPIVGPAIKSGTEKAAAKIRSMYYGTPYDKELEAVKNYNAQSAEAHSTLNTTGQVVGAVAPMLPIAATGVGGRALGVVGNNLLERAAAGGATNALIGAADTAARGGNFKESMLGGAASGAFGAGAPYVGAGFGGLVNRVVSPAADAVTNRLLQRAEELGIPIRGAQTSTSPFIQKLDQMAGKFPGSGQGDVAGAQRDALTRAVSRTFGENADRLTPEVMANARDRIGRVFESVAERTPIIHADDRLAHELTTVVRNAQDTMTPGEVEPLARQVRNIAALVDPNSHTITGEIYQNLTKRGSPLSNAMNAPNPNISNAAHEIRDALDGAMERSASQSVLRDLRQARSEWRNMRTVEPLVANGTGGDATINPLRLQSRVAANYKGTHGMAYGGGGDLADIARIGQRFFRQPSDSGTPLGTVIMNELLRHGGLIAGAGLAGTGYARGWDPAEFGIGAASLAGGAGLSRAVSAVLNRPHVVNQLLSRAALAAPEANRLRSDQ